MKHAHGRVSVKCSQNGGVEDAWNPSDVTTSDAGRAVWGDVGVGRD